KQQGLLESDASGMRLTEAGVKLLDDMEPMINELFGLSELAEQLRARYNLKQVIVVPGDSDQSAYTKKELGRAGAAAMRKYAVKDEVIAVAGGSTMAEIANVLTPSVQMKGN